VAGGANGNETVKIQRRANHLRATEPRDGDASRGCLSPTRRQPCDVLRVEEEVHPHGGVGVARAARRERTAQAPGGGSDVGQADIVRRG